MSLLTAAMPPWIRWAALAIALLSVYAMGRWDGARIAGSAINAQRAAEALAVSTWLEEDARRGQRVGQAHEQEKERIRVVQQTITKAVDRIVERPVYRDCALDDDGLREYNAALRGALDPAGEPDSAVPAAADPH